MSPVPGHPAPAEPAAADLPAAEPSAADPPAADPLQGDRQRLQDQAAAVFDFCHPALALRAVLLVQLALAAFALAGAADLNHWAARQALASFGGLFATLLWLACACAARRALRPLSRGPRWGVLAAGGAAAAMAAIALLHWAAFHDGALAFALGAAALAGALLASLMWAWLDLRVRLWHPAYTSARLAELQSRIRPHFLFNTLNTAIALVRVDPARAEGVLEDLAQLFRMALADPRAAVSLDEEVEIARRYLQIEQLRFGPRLQVLWDIDAAAGATRVPPLTLQPLVENAVRHGIEPRADGGWLRVQTARRHGQAEVIVTNSVGPATAGTPTAGHGMALANLGERLRLLHDLAARLETGRAREGDAEVFRARIVLPQE